MRIVPNCAELRRAAPNCAELRVELRAELRSELRASRVRRTDIAWNFSSCFRVFVSGGGFFLHTPAARLQMYRCTFSSSSPSFTALYLS